MSRNSGLNESCNGNGPALEPKDSFGSANSIKKNPSDYSSDNWTPVLTSAAVSKALPVFNPVATVEENSEDEDSITFSCRDGVSIMSDYLELQSTGKCEFYRVLCRRLDVRAETQGFIFFTAIANAVMTGALSDKLLSNMLNSFSLCCLGCDASNCPLTVGSLTDILKSAFEQIMDCVKVLHFK